MKRLMLIILLSVIGMEARCAYFEDGKMWEYFVDIYRTDSTDYCFYIMFDTIDGDTVVENKACKKIRHAEYHNPDVEYWTYDYLYDTEWWKNQSPDNVWWTYEYEDSNRVYRYYDDTQCFKKIMDFNLQLGDTVKKMSECYINYWDDWVVDWIGYMDIRGYKRKVIGLCINYYIFLAEDIGYFGMEDIGNFTKNGATRYLMRCFQGDEVIFFGYDYELETNIKGTEIDMDEQKPLYDLMGRRVEHPQRGSLYIRGGKKLIWQE